jgi:glycosyltransferase involved in cell wall biosynthesis
MRILIVTDQYAPMVGGVPNVTRTLALGLVRRGHTVAMMTPRPGGSQLVASGQANDHGVAMSYCRSVPWPWYDGMRLGCLSPAGARGLVRAFGPDVTHVHSPMTLGGIVTLVARRLAIPVVYTNHYVPENVRPTSGRRSRIFDRAYYAYLVWFSNLSSHVTAPTSTALRLLRDQGLRAPSRVISNGVDRAIYRPGPGCDRIRARYGLSADSPVVLSVGRLSREKDIGIILQATAMLTRDAQVAIVGTGPDERRLKALAERLSLANRVRFLGHVPAADLPELYRLAEVFVIASRAELQSLATMEAMASGLPVVAANAYSLSELVCHGRNGFLASPGSGSELAAYLDQLLARPDLRAAMARESLQLISAHELSRSLADWEALYGLLAAAGPR